MRYDKTSFQWRPLYGCQRVSRLVVLIYTFTGDRIPRQKRIQSLLISCRSKEIVAPCRAFFKAHTHTHTQETRKKLASVNRSILSELFQSEKNVQVDSIHTQEKFSEDFFLGGSVCSGVCSVLSHRWKFLRAARALSLRHLAQQPAGRSRGLCLFYHKTEVHKSSQRHHGKSKMLL